MYSGEWLDVTCTHTIVWLEGSVGGSELVVTMWCKDGREMVLKNAGDWVYSQPWPIVTTYVVCDKRWYSNEMSWWYFILFDCWMNSASFSCLTLVRCHGLCCIFVVWDFLAGFSWFLWGRCEIWLWELMLFLCITFVCDFLMGVHMLFLLHT